MLWALTLKFVKELCFVKIISDDLLILCNMKHRIHERSTSRHDLLRDSVNSSRMDDFGALFIVSL